MLGRRIGYIVLALVAAATIALAGCKSAPGSTGQAEDAAALSATPAVARSGSSSAPSATVGSAILPDTVTAAGNGKALSSPDIAEMTFGVSARDSSAENAMDAVSKTGKKIADALKDEGIAEKDIQTAGVSLYPQTDSNGKVTEFHASISVRATVREIATLGKVIAAATKAGSNEVMGPMFAMDEANPARNKAIEGAIADAKVRATVMAKAAGRTLGRVVAVVESGAGPTPYYGERMAKDMAAAVPIEPGQVETAASVSVTFELR